MSYRTPSPPESSPWELIVEGLLYEHLNVPETWVARREGEVALLVGGRAHFGHHTEIYEELRRPAHQRAPLVGARSFETGQVQRPDGSLRSWDFAVCPWPAATGMNLHGMSSYLPAKRFAPAAAIEVAAQLAAARQLAPGTLLTRGRIVVFETGETRIMPALPKIQADAEISFDLVNFADYLGDTYPTPSPNSTVASALFELLTGFGTDYTLFRETLAAQLESEGQEETQPPPLPSDRGVHLPAGFREPDALDRLVAHGRHEIDYSPACYLESLQALSRALGGREALARAVQECLAQAALTPPAVDRHWDGSRRHSLLPCF